MMTKKAAVDLPYHFDHLQVICWPFVATLIEVFQSTSSEITSSRLYFAAPEKNDCKWLAVTTGCSSIKKWLAVNC